MDNQRFLLSTGSFFLLVAIITRWEPVSSLECYQCSTDKDSNCPGNSSTVNCTYAARNWQRNRNLNYTSFYNDNNETTMIETDKCNKTEGCTEGKIFACFKTTFHIPEYRGDGNEKEMEEPREMYYCGLASEDEANKCNRKKTREYQRTDCICTHDKCNGSGRLFLAPFLYPIIMLTVLLTRSNFFLQ